MFRYLFGVLCIVHLSACSSSTTEVISQNAIKDVKNITEAVERIEKQTVKECKTDALMSNLEALKSQAVSISSQIKTIELSCTTEKEVLQEKIIVRNVIIGCLALLFVLLIWIRRKI